MQEPDPPLTAADTAVVARRAPSPRARRTAAPDGSGTPSSRSAARVRPCCTAVTFLRSAFLAVVGAGWLLNAGLLNGGVMLTSSGGAGGNAPIASATAPTLALGAGRLRAADADGAPLFALSDIDVAAAARVHRRCFTPRDGPRFSWALQRVAHGQYKSEADMLVYGNVYTAPGCARAADDDVVPVTHMTMDRLPKLRTLARRWLARAPPAVGAGDAGPARGCLSVAVLLCEQREATALERVFQGDELLAGHVSVHVVLARKPKRYPFNVMRNAAMEPWASAFGRQLLAIRPHAARARVRAAHAAALSKLLWWMSETPRGVPPALSPAFPPEAFPPEAFPPEAFPPEAFPPEAFPPEAAAAPGGGAAAAAGLLPLRAPSPPPTAPQRRWDGDAAPPPRTGAGFAQAEEEEEVGGDELVPRRAPAPAPVDVVTTAGSGGLRVGAGGAPRQPAGQPAAAEAEADDEDDREALAEAEAAAAAEGDDEGGGGGGGGGGEDGGGDTTVTWNHERGGSTAGDDGFAVPLRAAAPPAAPAPPLPVRRIRRPPAADGRDPDAEDDTEGLAGDDEAAPGEEGEGEGGRRGRFAGGGGTDDGDDGSAVRGGARGGVRGRGDAGADGEDGADGEEEVGDEADGAAAPRRAAFAADESDDAGEDDAGHAGGRRRLLQRRPRHGGRGGVHEWKSPFRRPAAADGGTGDAAADVAAGDDGDDAGDGGGDGTPWGPAHGGAVAAPERHDAFPGRAARARPPAPPQRPLPTSRPWLFTLDIDALPSVGEAGFRAVMAEVAAADGSGAALADAEAALAAGTAGAASVGDDGLPPFRRLYSVVAFEAPASAAARDGGAGVFGAFAAAPVAGVTRGRQYAWLRARAAAGAVRIFSDYTKGAYLGALPLRSWLDPAGPFHGRAVPVEYMPKHEPYFIAKPPLPPFAEILRGRGYSKSGWFFETVGTGEYSIAALPEVFLLVDIRDDDYRGAGGDAVTRPRAQNQRYFNSLMRELGIAFECSKRGCVFTKHPLPDRVGRPRVSRRQADLGA